MPLVDKATIALMRVISSEPRLRLIELIGLGHDHPDDMAKKMETTRQAVDKHLEILLSLGFVERDARYPPGGRPKIIYRLTPTAVDLFGEISKLVAGYRARQVEELRKELEGADLDLAQGKIDAEVHARRTKELREKYAFVAEEVPVVVRSSSPVKKTK